MSLGQIIRIYFSSNGILLLIFQWVIKVASTFYRELLLWDKRNISYSEHYAEILCPKKASNSTVQEVLPVTVPYYV